MTGTIGLLTPVQSAQMRVAALNVGELTPPTPEEATGWLYQARTANWSILDHTRCFEMIRWRTGILKAQRQARRAGEVFNSMQPVIVSPKIISVLCSNGARQWTGLDHVARGMDTSVENLP